MRTDAVVINASPLIALFRSGQADLLPRLFDRIVVPDAVWKEVVQDEQADPAALDFPAQPWPVRESVEISPRVSPWNLGAGETAVLSLALSYPTLRAVIDDADARGAAHERSAFQCLALAEYCCWPSAAACCPRWMKDWTSCNAPVCGVPTISSIC